MRRASNVGAQAAAYAVEVMEEKRGHRGGAGPDPRHPAGKNYMHVGERADARAHGNLPWLTLSPCPDDAWGCVLVPGSRLDGRCNDSNPFAACTRPPALAQHRQLGREGIVTASKAEACPSKAAHDTSAEVYP